MLNILWLLHWLMGFWVWFKRMDDVTKLFNYRWFLAQSRHVYHKTFSRCNAPDLRKPASFFSVSFVLFFSWKIVFLYVLITIPLIIKFYWNWIRCILFYYFLSFNMSYSFNGMGWNAFIYQFIDWFYF